MSPTKRISEDILIICQIIASFLIVTVALINLSLTDRDKALWSTLLGAGFGYVVPNPKPKRLTSCSTNDVAVHSISPVEYVDGVVSPECGVEVHDEAK